MTIPVPSAKYNLLQDTKNGPKRFKISLCLYLVALIVLIIIISPLIFPLIYDSNKNYTAIKDGRFMSRAELYSFDQNLNKKAPCKLCNSQLDIIDNLNDGALAKLVCYYNFPTTPNDTSDLMPENIDCNLCTHINVGFAQIHNNSIFLSDTMKIIIPRLVKLKSCNSALKFLLSVGGASAGGFSDMVVTHASRKVFIRSLKAILRSYKLDGVDLDWEFPVISERYSNNNVQIFSGGRQRQHFSQLLHEIRSEYVREKRDYLLTLAVAAPEQIVNAAYDIGEINQYADYINLMTYDFHFYTKYTPFTGLNSPLFKRSEDFLYMASLNINYSAHLWMNGGMDRNKIVVGLPTYGHSFSLVNSENALIGSPASGHGKLGNFGFVDYADLCDFINSNPDVTISYDNRTFSPFLYKDHEWVSYENKESIMAKGRYVKDFRFGGAMIYSLNSDDFASRCSGNTNDRFYLTRQLRDVLYDNDL